MTDTPDGKNFAEVLMHRMSQMDTRVAGVETRTDALAENMQHVRSDVRTLLDRQSTPKPVNFAGWAAVVLTIIGGLFWQDERQQQFVELTLRPIRAELEERYSSDVMSQKDRKALNEASTRNETKLLYIDRNIAEHQSWMQSHQDRIRDLEVAVGRINATLSGERAE